MSPDIWIIFLAASLGGSLLYNAFQQMDIKQLRESFDRVLDNAARADERATETAKIHQELLSRPVQALIPQNSIEIIAHAVAESLNGANTLIFPTKKDKLQ